MVYKLDFNAANDYQDPEDIKRIIKVALDHEIILSANEAISAWCEYSESVCAGWLILPKDDEALWTYLPAWAKGE